MQKQCWICKNTEEDFVKQKNDLLNSINTELEELEKYAQNIITEKKEELGFSEEQKSIVRNIKEVYASMTYNAVLENKENFFQLEPALKILFEYVSKYYEGKNQLVSTRNNSRFKKVKDIIDVFLQEPLECRYAKDLKLNEQKISALKSQKKQLEQINSFFIEKDMTPAKIDSVLRKNNQIIVDSNYNEKDNEYPFSFERLGFSFNKKILICPVCMTLLSEASAASFEVKEAQKRANDVIFDDYDE